LHLIITRKTKEQRKEIIKLPKSFKSKFNGGGNYDLLFLFSARGWRRHNVATSAQVQPGGTDMDCAMLP
jgi:hypothetical protein